MSFQSWNYLSKCNQGIFRLFAHVLWYLQVSKDNSDTLKLNNFQNINQEQNTSMCVTAFFWNTYAPWTYQGFAIFGRGDMMH